MILILTDPPMTLQLEILTKTPLFFGKYIVNNTPQGKKVLETKDEHISKYDFK